MFVLASSPLSSPLHLRRDDRVSLCSAISPFRATLATRSASPRAFLPALPAPHSPRLNSTTMPPLILTMVRHGESMDNLRSVWAGHRDAALSHHGFEQSMRLATHFKDVPITAIYTSDLKRAHTTAKNVFEANLSDPKPPFTVSPLLREQYFGIAEGQAWEAGAFSSTHENRAFQLAPEAESLNDVGRRASAVLRHFIAPHILATASPTAEQQHVAIFAHGIFLSEMMYAIQRAGLNGKSIRFVRAGSYTNTGWARLELSLHDPTSTVDAGTNGTTPAVNLDDVSPLTLPPRHAELPPSIPSHVHVPTIAHTVLAMDQTEHLNGLVRQKGGIGSGPHDPNQKKLEAFFGGGGGSKST